MTNDAHKLVIFDLDQTLIDETLYSEAENIILKLSKQNINMSVASFNKHATWFCKRYSIDKYFDIICGYKSASKMEHITEIKRFYDSKGLFYLDKNIIFFDDDADNIKEVRTKSGIACVKVNPDTGLKKNDIISMNIFDDE